MPGTIETKRRGRANSIGRALNRLGQQLRGRLSLPGDDGYAAATAIWAKPTCLMPRAVAHCWTAEDVQHTIRAARECDVALSVRGGGHDWAGRALCDGIVIDLAAMTNVSVAADGRTAWIAGGARAVDVVEATDPRGLAAVTGSCGAVGMTGMTLGGGYGPLIGRFGLALDNMIAAEVVLSDGRIVTASQQQDQELYWALRGGGGNFGVVTAMRQCLHPLSRIRSGMLVFPFAEAARVLEACADIAACAPDELNIQLGFATRADRAPMVMIVPTWSGAPEQDESQIAPFLNLGPLLACMLDVTTFRGRLRMLDPYIVNGQRVCMETCWLPALDRRGIDALLGAIWCAVSSGCAIFTHDFRGAAARVPVEATAFGLRRNHVLIEILAAFGDGSDGHAELRHRQWAQSTRRALDGLALPGGYPNLLAGDDLERAAKAYGPNADRLIKAKRDYDPDNVFCSATPLPRRTPEHRSVA
jgi:FAD/FMN-containing dehydrogenase